MIKSDQILSDFRNIRYQYSQSNAFCAHALSSIAINTLVFTIFFLLWMSNTDLFCPSGFITNLELKAVNFDTNKSDLIS